MIHNYFQKLKMKRLAIFLLLAIFIPAMTYPTTISESDSKKTETESLEDILENTEPGPAKVNITLLMVHHC